MISLLLSQLALAAGVWAMDHQHPFFLLKANVPNIISQKDIIGEPKYELYDVQKSGSSVDFGISVYRHNSTRLLEEVGIFQVKSDGYLRLTHIEFDTGENDLTTLVVTSDAVYIYEVSRYDPETKKSLLFEWSFKNNSFAGSDIKCVDPKECQILRDAYFTHRSSVIVVVLEIRRCVIPTNRFVPCSKHLVILKLNQTETLKGEYRLETAQMIALNESEALICECEDPGLQTIRMVKRNKEGNKNLEAAVIRYCPITKNRRSSALSLYKLEQEKGQFSLTKPKVLARVFIGKISYVLTILKVFSIGDFLIIANKERILSWSNTALYDTLTSLTNQRPTGISSVFTFQIDNIWCNHMNYNEMSCLYQHSNKSSNNVTRRYQSIDLIQIEGSITIIHSNNNIIWSGFDFRKVFSTKHFILINLQTGQNKTTETFLCDKRISAIQLVSLSEDLLLSQCLRLSVKKDHSMVTYSSLLFDDNFNNELNGYLIVAFKERNKDSNLYSISPVLLSGQYFEIIPTIDLTDQICHRYMDHCATFDLIFKSKIVEKGAKVDVEVKRRFYVLNNKFSSVLPKASIKEAFTNLTASNLMLHPDDFFLGDLNRLQLSNFHRVFIPEIQGVPRRVVQSHTQSVLPIKYQFSFPSPKFTSKVDSTGSNFFLEWSQIRLHENKPLAFSFYFFSKDKVEFSTGKVFRNSIFFSTFAQLDLDESNTQVDQKYLISQKQFFQESPPLGFNITTRNTDPSAVNYIKLTYSTNGSSSILTIALWNLGGQTIKENITNLIASKDIALRKGETVLWIRSPLDLSMDYFALITRLRIMIFAIEVDDSGFTNLKTVKNILLTRINFSDDPSQKILNSSVTDLLYFHNLLILDTNLTLKDTAEVENVDVHRIYIFFMNPLVDSIFKLGYINMDSGVKNYSLCYYHQESKAILVLPHTKEIKEYLIDSIKLDLRKIGKEIKPINTLDMREYGSLVIEQILPPLSQNSILHSRTLGGPMLEGYFIILIKTSGNSVTQNVALIAEITDDPLFFFKSHFIQLEHPSCQLNIPCTVFDDDSEVLPVVEVCTPNFVVNVHLLWIKSSIDLNLHYHHSNLDFEEDGHINLHLSFQDMHKKDYEESLSISRSHRYLINSDLPSSILVSEGAEVLPLQAGLVNSMSIECLTGTTALLLERNGTRRFDCFTEKFSATLVPSVTKESHLTLNPYKTYRIKDFRKVHIAYNQTLKGLFALLLNDSFIVVRSYKDNLQTLLYLNLKLDTSLSYDCVSIKEIKMPTSMLNSSLTVHLFCSIGSNLKEVVMNISCQDLKKAVEHGTKKKKVNASCLDITEVPPRLKNSILFNQNDHKAIDDLLFVVSKKNILSYGEKLAFDIYKVTEQKDQQHRFVLLNSTINEKSDYWTLVSFKIMPINPPEPLSFSDKYYLLLRLNQSKKDKLRMTFLILKYDNNQVEEYSNKPFYITLPPAFSLKNSGVDFMSLVSEVTPQKYEIGGEEWKESLNNHYIFGVIDSTVFEYEIGAPIDMKREAANKNPLMYDFSGICYPRSQYFIEVSSQYLILTCVPELSEMQPSFIIIFKKQNSSSKIGSGKLNTPLQVLRFEVGLKSPKEGLVKLIVESNGIHRLLKTSKRTILTKYLLVEKSYLTVQPDPSSWSKRGLKLNLENLFEKQEVVLEIEANKVKLLIRYTRFLQEDVALPVVLGIYLLFLLVLISGANYLAGRSLFSIVKNKEPEVSAKPFRISKRQLTQQLLTDAF